MGSRDRDEAPHARRRRLVDVLERHDAPERVRDHIDGAGTGLVEDVVDEATEPRRGTLDTGEPRVVEPVERAETAACETAREPDETDPVLHVAVHEHDRAVAGAPQPPS